MTAKVRFGWRKTARNYLPLSGGITRPLRNNGATTLQIWRYPILTAIASRRYFSRAPGCALFLMAVAAALLTFACEPLPEGRISLAATTDGLMIVDDAGNHRQDRANRVLLHRAVGPEPSRPWSSGPSGQYPSLQYRAMGTDFSAPARLQLLANKPGFWIATLALAASLVAVCIILAQCGRKEVIRAIIILAVSVGVEALLIRWALAAGFEDYWLFPTGFLVLCLAFLLFVSASTVSLIVLLVRSSKDSHSLSSALTLASFVTVSYAFAFPFLFAFHETDLLVPITLAIIPVLLAAAPYWPRGKRSLIPFWTAGAVLPALLLPTILWLLYLIPEGAAKFMGLALGIAAALIMFDYLHGWKWRNHLIGRPESQILDTDAEN